MADSVELSRRDLLDRVTRFRRWQRHPDALEICAALERRLVAEAQAAKGVTGNGHVTSADGGHVTVQAPIDPIVCPDCMARKKIARERKAKSRAKQVGNAKADHSKAKASKSKAA